VRAVAIDRFGGPEVMQVRALPDPKLGPDSVVIAVKAAGVNPVDFKTRQGGLEGRFNHRFPLILGWDAAGAVDAVGPAVVDFAPGDAVMAYCRKTEIAEGTYAEKVAVPRTFVARKPERASFVEAAAMPLVGLTAWQALTEGLALEAGETLLVTAAAGGVGHVAVQLARALGAEVIGTASGPNHDFIRALGATLAIDYRNRDVAAAIRERYPDGIDAALDVVGGDGQAAARAALRTGGRIASIVDPEPTRGSADVTGRYIFVRPDGEGLSELARRFDAGELRVEIADTFPLEHAAEAHRRLEGGHVRGKLVIKIGS
jgi:NADPH:quinone reductase-like Zn-dependent oxidoreductase